MAKRKVRPYQQILANRKTKKRPHENLLYRIKHGDAPGWKVVTDKNGKEMPAVDEEFFLPAFGGNRTNFKKFFKEALDPNVSYDEKDGLIQRAVPRMNPRIQLVERSLKGHVQGHELYHDPSFYNADRVVMFRHFKHLIMEKLADMNPPYQARWSMSFTIQFKKWSSPDKKEETIRCSPTYTVGKEQALKHYEDTQHELEAWIERMEAKNGSGWYPEKIIHVYFNFHKYNPLKGRSYFPIPGYTNPKCGLVNIKNDDTLCFLWSLCAAVQYYDKGGDKTKVWNNTDRYKTTFNKYWKLLTPRQQQVFQTEGMDVNQITYHDLEKIFHVRIKVIQMEIEGDTCFSPHVITNRSNAPYKREVILLRAWKNTGETHYVWVKNLDHFLSRDFKPGHDHPEKLCMECLLRVPRASFDDHVCGQGPFKTLYVTKKVEKGKTKPYVRFKEGTRKQEPVSLVIYADFEALNITTYDESSTHSTIKKSVQHAISYAFLPVVSVKDEVTGEQFKAQGIRMYRGENAAEVFMDKIVAYCKDNFRRYIYKHYPMEDLTPEEQAEWEAAEICHLCEKEGNWQPDKAPGVHHAYTKVKDHCHYTGKYRGAAHSKCNMKYGKWPIVTVVFHNLKGYDSHFLIKALQPWHGQEKILPDNMQKFKSFELARYHRLSDGRIRMYTIRFIDSFAFLQNSLDKLVHLSMSDGDDQGRVHENGLLRNFTYTKQFLEQRVPNHLQERDRAMIKTYLMRKGYFPYEWFDSADKFNLPLFDENDKFVLQPTDFYSSLAGKFSQEIVHKQQWCQLVCEMMEYKTFGDYHDLYLGLDVCLLADVFQSYRMARLTASNSGLDPCHYFGTPSVVYDSFLRFFGEEIPVFDSVALYQKIRKDGMRGGISYWKTYYTKANNDLHPDHDMTKPETHIFDKDCTSLYPWAARQRLPFEENLQENVVEEELTGEAMWEYIINMLFHWPEDRGCYLYVDMYLPVDAQEWMNQVPEIFHRYKEPIRKHFDNNLHDYQAEYPIIVENKVVPTEWLSERQQQLYQVMGKHVPCNKLINDLHPKINHLIYYLTLRQALERGWVITKIHSRMDFRQEYCLKEFMDTCVEERAKAKNEFGKKLQKDNMNSCVGKTITDPEKFTVIKMFRDADALAQNERRGRIKDVKILTEDKVLAELFTKRTELGQPIMLGIAVYDISKILMSSLWYMLQDHYGKKIKLLGTDTDSLIFCVETSTWEQDIRMFNQRSVFEQDHPFYKNSRFSDKLTKQLQERGINPYIGIFDTGEKYMKSVPGFFKPDHDNIIECCALRSKMYSFRRNVRGEPVWVPDKEPGKWVQEDLMDVQLTNMTSDMVSKKKHRDVCKAKGIPSGVVDEQFTHEYFRSVVLEPFEHTSEKVTSHRIQPKNHEIYVVEQTKSSLKAVDDKRYSEDGITSLPFGHYRIPK